MIRIIFLLFVVSALTKYHYQDEHEWYIYTRDNCYYNYNAGKQQCKESWTKLSHETDLYRNYTDIGNTVHIRFNSTNQKNISSDEQFIMYVSSVVDDNSLTPTQKKI